MKQVIESWEDGLRNLLAEDFISFYTFFTVLLAECAYLWAFCSKNEAISMTVFLAIYALNVIVSALLKGYWEGTRTEVVCSVFYVIAFLIFFTAGCFTNGKRNVIMTAIPLVTTFIWIGIRYFQEYGGFKSFYTWLVSQIIVIGAPFIAFTVCLASISDVPIALKIVIPIVYLACAPWIAYFEDNSCSCSIFGIVWDITWNKELEELTEELEKNEKLEEELKDDHENEKKKPK